MPALPIAPGGPWGPATSLASHPSADKESATTIRVDHALLISPTSSQTTTGRTQAPKPGMPFVWYSGVAIGAQRTSLRSVGRSEVRRGYRLTYPKEGVRQDLLRRRSTCVTTLIVTRNAYGSKETGRLIAILNVGAHPPSTTPRRHRPG